MSDQDHQVMIAFRDAMAAADVRITENIIADSKIHRYHVGGDRKRTRNGWAVLYLDGTPAGAFGTMKGGTTIKWSAKGVTPLSREERKALAAKAKADRARRAEEEAAVRAEAAAAANKMWDAAEPCQTHPYLTKKRIASYGLRQATWVKEFTDATTGELREIKIPGALLVPLHNSSREIVSLQAIFPNDKNQLGRGKDFLTGGEKRGCYFTIGNQLDSAAPVTIGICEGYATGASIHNATGLTVLVAFDAGNLQRVAETARRQMPHARIVIFADNDQWTTKPIVNPGVTRATEASRAVGGAVAIPRFADVLSQPTDWNDLARLMGEEEVRVQINLVITSIRESEDEMPMPSALAQKERGRPRIQVIAGTLAQQASEGEIALLDSDIGIYERGMTLVHVVYRDVPARGGQQINVARLKPLTKIGIRDLLSRYVQFVRFNQREQAWLPIDPPDKVAETILNRSGEWRFPSVEGIILTPTLREDGTLLLERGYDAKSRLLLLEDLAMPDIKTAPTKADALQALQCLVDLINEFPFLDEVSRSVALSAIMTPVLRAAIPKAPMHVIRAPTPGSGKSYLLDVASMISTGQVCPVMSFGQNPEEFEKRIHGALLAGEPIISIDNVNGELGGDALCQAIERPRMNIRALGASDLTNVCSRACIFANGNNLRLVGDVSRRALICTLDPQIERPEMRKFQSNPVAKVQEDRGLYVAAVLTIARAYIAAGRPTPAGSFASFSEWSLVVRSPLIWLGFPDPVGSMSTAREDDPDFQAFCEMVSSWRERIGTGANKKMTARGIIAAANQRPGKLLDALQCTALNKFGNLDPKTLGKYLRSWEGRIVDDLRVRKEIDTGGHAAQWWLEIADERKVRLDAPGSSVASGEIV